MTQDERDLLVWVARKIAGLQFTDQRHEAPYVDAMIRKIREGERLQQEPRHIAPTLPTVGILGSAGCICPPGANATCANLHCPRRLARPMQAT